MLAQILDFWPIAKKVQFWVQILCNFYYYFQKVFREISLSFLTHKIVTSWILQYKEESVLTHFSGKGCQNSMSLIHLGVSLHLPVSREAPLKKGSSHQIKELPSFLEICQGPEKKKKKISRKTQTDQLNPKIFFLGNSTLVFSLSSFGKIEDIQLWSFPKSCAFNTTHSLFWCQKIVEDLAYLPKETPLWHLLNRVPLLPPLSRGLMGKHVQRQLICMTRLCTMRVFLVKNSMLFKESQIFS